MVTGMGTMTFRLHGCRSLKAKRKIVKTIVAKIRNKFNASVAEVDLNDVYESTVIGFSTVGNDGRLINSAMDKIIDFAEELNLAELMDSSIEIVNS